MTVAQEHRDQAPETLGFALLTVSDTRMQADDESGRRARAAVEAAGHHIAEALVVRDETAAIRQALGAMLARADVDVVVVTGGTGIAPRDVTIEAVEPLLDRTLPGFGELFRMLSYRDIGAAAMLSRATAGVAEGRAVFALPGSPAAVDLALAELVLPEAAHVVAQARRGRTG